MTELTAQGDVAAPGSIQAPAGARKIVQIIAAIGQLIKEGTFGNVFLRMSGKGIGSTEQVVCLGGVSGAITTSGQTATVTTPVIIPTDIDVIGGNPITLKAVMTGGAMGTNGKLNVCVTLVMQ